MPVHDVNGSLVNLAKGWLLTLDRSSLETKIPTATLELVLTALVDTLTPVQQVDVAAQAGRTVMGAAAMISEAERARE